MNYEYDSMTDEAIIELLRNWNDETRSSDMASDEAAKERMKAAKVAADRGSAEAQFIFAKLLLDAKEPERDEKLAGDYFRRSAEQAYAPALHMLGVCRQVGACGFEQDFVKSAEYFTKAADLGSLQAMVHLYAMYHEGTGVEKNRDKAIGYLKAASEADYFPACVMLGMELMNAPDASPEQHAEAAALFLRAAEGGEPIGQFFYGICCEKGVGVEKDLSEAAGWYRKSAKAGNVQANEALKKLGFPGVM